MSGSRWDTYAICPGCAAKYRAAFGRVFFLMFEVCPACGEPKIDEHAWRQEPWAVRTMRWVSTARLLRPSTWGTGRWEERP